MEIPEQLSDVMKATIMEFVTRMAVAAENDEENGGNEMKIQTLTDFHNVMCRTIVAHEQLGMMKAHKQIANVSLN